VILALTRQGQIQAHQNQLYQAAETYQQVLELICEYSPSNAAVAYISLARIHYEWNDLETTEKYLEQGLQLARQYDQLADRVILGELYLARLKLARGDVIGAADSLSQLEQKARQNNIPARLQDLAFLQARIYLRQGDSNAAVQMARQKNFTLIQARALIAQGKPSAALEVVEPLLLQQAKERCWADRLLEVMAVQSIALYVSGEKEKAVAQLSEALAAAEAGGFIRLFLDEGPLMAELLSTAAAQGIHLNYVNKLLAAFAAEPKEQRSTGSLASSLALADPLTPREVEVLRLIASGLSNQEIGARLFLALDTVKGHNRRIFEKLQVQRRTEAIARARELGLI
jgi:LuxR family maltose regulon positive regulatory protein